MGRLSLVHIVLLAVSFATASFARNASITANNSQAVEQSEAAANHSIGESNEKGIFCAGGFCDVSDLSIIGVLHSLEKWNIHPFALTVKAFPLSACLHLPYALSPCLTLYHSITQWLVTSASRAVALCLSLFLEYSDALARACASHWLHTLS